MYVTSTIRIPLFCNLVFSFAAVRLSPLPVRLQSMWSDQLKANLCHISADLCLLRCCRVVFVYFYAFCFVMTCAVCVGVLCLALGVWSQAVARLGSFFSFIDMPHGLLAFTSCFAGLLAVDLYKGTFVASCQGHCISRNCSDCGQSNVSSLVNSWPVGAGTAICACGQLSCLFLVIAPTHTGCLTHFGRLMGPGPNMLA